MAISHDATERSTNSRGRDRGSAQMARRLAFLCHPFHRGGVTQWMRDAAVEFAARGWAVDFVTVAPRGPFVSGGSQPMMARWVPSSERLRVHAAPVGYEFELGTERYRASVYRVGLLRAVGKGVPVIVSNDAAAWRGAAQIAGRNPLVGVLHADEDYYYALGERHADAATALVCVSHRIANTVRARLGKHAPQVAVIPCGVTLEAARAVIGNALDLKLAWVGRIEQRQKRVLDLPVMLGRLVAAGVHATLALIGDGPDREALREALDAEGVSSRVRWLGWLPGPGVREELASADVLLLPSAFEGMPLVVMEALAEGCAVVSSRVSGVEDLASHPLAANCVWTHAAGDLDDAVTLVRRASAVPPKHRRAAARALAEAVCSLPVCVDRYEELLSTLAPVAGDRISAVRLEHLMASALSVPVALARRARLWLARTSV